MTFGKLDKSEAGYRPCTVHDRNGGFDRCCKDCRFLYRSEHGVRAVLLCTKVAGTIQRSDTCRLFEPHGSE